MRNVREKKCLALVKCVRAIRDKETCCEEEQQNDRGDEERTVKV